MQNLYTFTTNALLYIALISVLSSMLIFVIADALRKIEFKNKLSEKMPPKGSKTKVVKI